MQSAWVGGHFVNQKFSAKLNFASDLDVRRFCTTECAETQGTMYELNAILLHTGTTRAGHWCILQRVSDTMFWLRNDNEAPQAVPQDLALSEYREHTAALLYRRKPFRYSSTLVLHLHVTKPYSLMHNGTLRYTLCQQTSDYCLQLLSLSVCKVVMVVLPVLIVRASANV